VLSSCVIDHENPFIREHAILCIKALLKDNAENQQLIASLEARKVVDDDAIREAGMQAEIVDGKLKLNKS
ncbi:hypothetical protein CANCADRAFT_17203, partial [Tortispora caseinolytica NRRL Y-17796]